MQVTYAINARLAGGGIGNTAYHALRAIQKRGWLKRLLVSSTKTHEFDQSGLRMLGLAGRLMKKIANYDPSNRLYTLGDSAFDAWASVQIPDCDIFHGWGNHALRSISSAHRHGAKTIIERGGSHVKYSYQLLREEYRRWGWRASGELQSTMNRCLREYDKTDFIMVPSQYNYDTFTALGFDPKRLLLMPLGVEVDRFTPNWDLPETPFRVLFAGQVSLRKGIGYLLNAWQQAQLPNAELLVAGELKADAAKVVEPFLNDTSIKWLGFVRDPAFLYRSAHVFVCPSIDEGSALVTYEAMAAGLACIVTHNSGSLIRDEIDGYVVPTGSAEKIAEKLCWLSTHPEARSNLARSARKAIEPMTWVKYGEALLETYQQCVMVSR